MPKAPMSDEEIQLMKNQIIDIAFRIVYEEGYSGLSMRKIATKLNMTAANLYNYFSNKDELNIEMRRYGFILLYKKLELAFNEKNSIDDKIRGIFSEFISFGFKNPFYYELLFNMPTPKYQDYVGTPMEEMASRELESSLQVLELMKKVVLDYADAGGIVLSDPVTNITIILSLLHGVITLYNNKMLDYFSPDPEKLVNTVVGIFVELILKLKSNAEAQQFLTNLEKLVTE